jgi:hypothetical protein
MRVAPFCPAPLLDALRREGLDTIEGAFAYASGQDLSKPGLGTRRRTRLVVTDDGGKAHDLYLKRYGPERPKARLRRRWTYGPRSSPAGVEFGNVSALRALGLPTMEPVCCGEEFGPLGAKRSYLIITAVPGDALERCFGQFLRRDTSGNRTVELTNALAEMVKTFHNAGFVHRDLYASHVFLDTDGDVSNLYLIDLARMFAPRGREFRWQVKDLAQSSGSGMRFWPDIRATLPDRSCVVIATQSITRWRPCAGGSVAGQNGLRER